MRGVILRSSSGHEGASTAICLSKDLDNIVLPSFYLIKYVSSGMGIILLANKQVVSIYYVVWRQIWHAKSGDCNSPIDEWKVVNMRLRAREVPIIAQASPKVLSYVVYRCVADIGTRI